MFFQTGFHDQLVRKNKLKNKINILIIKALFSCVFLLLKWRAVHPNG